MKKRDKIIIIGMLSVILLVVGVNVAKKVIRERNVFDEMYYSRVHRIYIDWYGAGGNFRTMFSNMPQMASVSRDSEMIHTEEGIFFEHYRQEYLEENETLHVSMNTDNKKMYMDFSCEDEDGYKWYVYCYYVADKLLVYDSNDPDNTERKNFLYEIFLPDWFEANEGVSHYSMDHLGKFTYRDDTVEEE
ncbi:MAG: hypothetical protein ACI4AA_08485 [Lachnospiraceae bacterium]